MGGYCRDVDATLSFFDNWVKVICAIGHFRRSIIIRYKYHLRHLFSCSLDCFSFACDRRNEVKKGENSYQSGNSNREYRDP